MRWLEQAKQPGEVSGRIDHLLGNCLMKLGNYEQAAIAYGDALGDTAYGHAGALASNRGRALLAAGKPQEAIAALSMATKDSSYATPYKAYVALGNAYSQIGDYREAGVAYRNAAIDENNPDPSAALRSLGGCFMKMGRAVDAVEAYRTALDFATPLENQNAIYEDLGMAYAAAARWDEAIDSFEHATQDGSHTLSAEAETARRAAQEAANSSSSAGTSGSTDAFLAAAASYGTGADPLDPLGKSGEFMPSPEDTGFFDITEQEMAQIDINDHNLKRKHRHSGLRGCLILVLLALLIVGAATAAYYNGYGWPLQENVVQDLFTTKANGGDVSGLLDDSLAEEDRASIVSVLPAGLTGAKVTGVDRGMTESTAMVEATLSAGGQQLYRVSLVRDGIGWKVADVVVEYSALDGGDAMLTSGTTSTTTASTPDAAASTETSTETTSTEEASSTETPAEETSTETETTTETE